MGARWEMELERRVKKGVEGLCVIRVLSSRPWKDMDIFSSERAVRTHCRKRPGQAGGGWTVGGSTGYWGGA